MIRHADIFRNVGLIIVTIAILLPHVKPKLVSHRVGDGFGNRGLYSEIMVPRRATLDRTMWLGGAIGYYGPIASRKVQNFNNICSWEGFTSQIGRPDLNRSSMAFSWNSAFCPQYFCSPDSPLYKLFTNNSNFIANSTTIMSLADSLLFSSCLYCSNLWNLSFTQIVQESCTFTNTTARARSVPALQLNQVERYSNGSQNSTGFYIGPFHPEVVLGVWYFLVFFMSPSPTHESVSLSPK
jgi:hypothetical protein